MAVLKEIKTGELAIGSDGDVFSTGSVGSCLVIVLYDGENRIGGLAHAMLPSGDHAFANGAVDFSTGNTSGKYVDVAIDNLVQGICHQGGKVENLSARLVGGATMFRRLTADKFGIGYQNIAAARDHLKKLKISIENEDTGGSSGKSVEFDLKTGMVKINTVI